jgi:hypothetical protein
VTSVFTGFSEISIHFPDMQLCPSPCISLHRTHMESETIPMGWLLPIYIAQLTSHACILLTDNLEAENLKKAPSHAAHLLSPLSGGFKLMYRFSHAITCHLQPFLWW